MRTVVLWVVTVLGVCALSLVAAPAARAAELSIETNLTDDGIAVNGCDPVAYFTKGEPTMGRSALQYEHQGIVYRFASEEHRQTFIANPPRYVPAYGGFCAYGVRTGRKFEIDPNSWRIVDGRLYLLLNPGTKVIWELQRSSNIQIANAIWPTIKPFPDEELEKRTP